MGAAERQTQNVLYLVGYTLLLALHLVSYLCEIH
uniref:Uncharacterized protein n=1 Tax=Anguilla anguilla TaxID=7936 RepID=A0A0E9WC93_ANGAN